MEWISVKDKLPNHEQSVIFYKKSGPRIGKFWLNVGREKPCFTSTSSLDYIVDGKVTHWMPLPNPPAKLKLNRNQIDKEMRL